jgi:peptidoglycan/LPS O-acetylase OafA/YrhL
MTSSTATQAENQPPTRGVVALSAQPRRSLKEGLAGHQNSFGVIRLVLAAAVIFSHAFPLGGWGEDPFVTLVRHQQNLGGMAVLGFFAISGYLITKSGTGADALQFIWRRFLRIFPAFWLVLLVAALIVGPAAWLMMGRNLGDYFGAGIGGPVHYFVANWKLTVGTYSIYDIFQTTTPYGLSGAGSVFNGSLWTLAYEWGSYLIVWAFVIFGVLKRARILVPVVTAFYFLLQVASKIVPGAAGQIFPYFADPYRVSLPLIFLFGACLALYSHKVPLDARLAALSAVVVLVTLRYGGLDILGYPAIAYFVMWLAAALPRSFQWIGAKNDYSYGIYVYGFLVEQFTAFLGWNRWGYVPWVLVCLAITVGCAWLSWHGLEKWALALKDFGPGKGLRFWYDRSRGLISRGHRQERAASTSE